MHFMMVYIYNIYAIYLKYIIFCIWQSRSWRFNVVSFGQININILSFHHRPALPHTWIERRSSADICSWRNKLPKKGLKSFNTTHTCHLPHTTLKVNAVGDKLWRGSVGFIFAFMVKKVTRVSLLYTFWSRRSKIIHSSQNQKSQL